MAEQRFYDENEAEEILKLAASRSGNALSNGMSRDSLLASAEELGISPDAVLAAEREIHDRKLAEADRNTFDAEQRSGFMTHLFWYAAVNSFLAWQAIGQGKNWYLWVLGGWGLGILANLWNVYLKPKALRDQEFQNWRLAKRQSDQLLERLGTTPDAILDEFTSGFNTPNKIEAIKLIRDKTGLGLAESKAIVEDYARRHPGQLE